ncbi:DUF998 domain-containing protein [Phycicoccus sp. CSK15P-2]|uniref:DUF998 domain-containing protein n=1 Tax=Phycicoccus sp. CSK15P-2 TaxID=2807627 RepID=UPI00195028BD|nr:DUF998 domain-containing protein [Phycicoccus sp. CSK15P-2]MBM6402966.1 DUF998 domain-containing protein [Phycicoccus sp. CSK15P-2]
MTAVSAPERRRAPEQRPAPDAPWFPVVLLGVALAVVGAIGTDLTGGNPLDDMLSHAVHRPAGWWWLTGCVVGMEIAAAGTALGVRRHLTTGRLRTTAFGLLTLWSVGLAAVAAVPSDVPGDPTTAAGRVHQLAAAAVVVGPPALGLLISNACSPRARTVLRRAVVGQAGLGTFFVALHVPVVLLGAEPGSGFGLVERLMLAGMTATAVLAAACLASVSPPPLTTGRGPQ